MPTFRPATGSAADRGRRRYNADAVAVHAADGRLGVAVADGIGDTPEAATAARAAADAAARAASLGDAVGAVLAARAALPADGDAVLVVASLGPDGGEVAWVGDARAYLDDGWAVRVLTTDQTMGAAVRAAGGSPHPRWDHVVTQSVRTAAVAAIGRTVVPPAAGRLALVTDGVHRRLGANEIGMILRGSPDPAAAARLLTDAALLAGGRDNASATVVDVAAPPPVPAQRTGTVPVAVSPALVRSGSRSPTS